MFSSGKHVQLGEVEEATVLNAIKDSIIKVIREYLDHFARGKRSCTFAVNYS